MRAAGRSGAAPFLVEMYIRVGYRVLSTDPRIAYLGKVALLADNHDETIPEKGLTNISTAGAPRSAETQRQL